MSARREYTSIDGDAVVNADGTLIRYMTPAAYKAAYGDALLVTSRTASGAAVLSIRTRSIDLVEAAMVGGDIAHRRNGDRLLVPAARGRNFVLEFVSAS